MTPAIAVLKSVKADFELLKYGHNDQVSDYGNEASDNLGVDKAHIFKCLMVEFDSTQYGVALVPVSTQLNTKKLLKLTAYKKVNMLAAAEIKKVSGYIAGGVSPFGQKRPYRTFVDSSIVPLKEVYVSAGKRGCAIKISSEQLLKYTAAIQGDIAAND